MTVRDEFLGDEVNSEEKRVKFLGYWQLKSLVALNNGRVLERVVREDELSAHEMELLETLFLIYRPWQS